MRKAALLAIGLCVSVNAAAQTPTPAELLPDLILRGITLPRPTVPDVISHEAHFSPIDTNDLNNPTVAVVSSFNKLIGAQLSTFPVGSSAGGFTYTFDESLGTFRRASNSFGPAFAERAITIGRGRLSGGMTYQHTPFQTIEGQRLDDGSIKFYLRHQECCTPGAGGGGAGTTTQPNGTRLSPAFEGDLIEAALSLRATTDTVAFFGTYGLTNRWDLGIVVPIVRMDMDASVQATIMRLATAAIPQIHTFEAGNPNATQKTFHESASATGLGDVLLRTKYRFLSLPGGGLAGAVDLRLPTGDEDQLLGAGGQVKVLLIASGEAGRLIPHANVGFTVSSGKLGATGLLAELGGSEPVPDEINYITGVEFVAHPKLTVVGDVVGRTLRRAGRLDMITKTFAYQGATAVQTAEFNEFERRGGNLNLALGTVGFKFNPAGDFLISANVLFPLTDAGLRSKLTTVIGVDYAF
jgi:outer membrane putative beta-barrel porin/alpha-amylase